MIAHVRSSELGGRVRVREGRLIPGVTVTETVTENLTVSQLLKNSGIAEGVE